MRDDDLTDLIFHYVVALLLIAALFIICSCAPQAVRVDGGAVVDSGWGEEAIDSLNLGRHYDTVRFSAGPQWRHPFGDGTFRLDVGLAATAMDVVSGVPGGPGFGVEATVRPTLDLGVIEPYVVGSAGWEAHLSRVGIQGTSWGFPLALGAGVRVEVSDGMAVTLDYRLHHMSNGADFLGDDIRPNPGYNDDLVFIGFEFDL